MVATLCVVVIHKDSISAEAQRANSIAAKILFGTDDTKFSEVMLRVVVAV